MSSLRTLAELVSALGILRTLGDKARKAAASAALAGMAGVLFLIGVIFLLVLAFRLIEHAVGPELALAIFGVAFLALGGVVLAVRANRDRPIPNPVDTARVEAELRMQAQRLTLPAIASAAVVAFMAARSLRRKPRDA